MHSKSLPKASGESQKEKIVRGRTYIEGGRYIEPPHRVHFFALDDEGARPVRELVEIAGTTFAREPGIVVRRAVSPEDGVSALYELEFWKQFKTHAAVLDHDP